MRFVELQRQWTNFTVLAFGRERRNYVVASFLFFFLLVSFSCSRLASVSYKVKFVALLRPPVVAQQVFLSGNTAQLGNWDPAAIPMKKESDSIWTVTLAIPEGEHLEYKVTAGSWWTQALDTNERVYDNVSLSVKKDTTITTYVYDWLNRMRHGRPILSQTRFLPQRQSLTLDGLWRYHEGDEMSWASPSFNDSAWVVTDPYIRWTRPADPRWEGRGWFRFHMYVDSSLWNTTLALRIEELGASQIYYNGRLLYSYGNVGSSTEPYEPNSMTWWRDFKVDPQYDQLIAVRYANTNWKSLLGMGYAPGFLIILRDINTAFQSAVDVRENAERQMFFTLIPLVLALVHLSLYGFLRSQRQNLYYAICMLGFAGLTYFSYERNLVVDVGQIILFNKLGEVSVSTAVLFGALTNYEMNYAVLPGRASVFVVFFAIVAALALLGFPPELVMTVNYVFFGLTTLEMFHIIFDKKTRRVYGGWILFVGFILLTVFVSIQLLIDYNLVPRTAVLSQSYAYGMMSLAVAMSIFLSYNFARVNRDLEVQLDTVRQLSEKALEQERVSHALELERKLIDLENVRKTKELESARELQLSLLPRSVPKIRGLDIAAIMKTATEVGGDYYDFFLSGNDGITVAVGDATGHGLKAGNLVTATKGLLNIVSRSEHVEDILIAANQAIKRMNLHMLTMCLAIARIEGRSMSYTSAGMPPLVVYRAATKRCENFILKAMPLGAVEHFPFSNLTIPLHEGDIVVMMSDGLLEIFNESEDTFGMENITSSLEHYAEKSADEIAHGLLENGRAWGGNAALADDLTIVLVKVTET